MFDASANDNFTFNFKGIHQVIDQLIQVHENSFLKKITTSFDTTQFLSPFTIRAKIAINARPVKKVKMWFSKSENCREWTIFKPCKTI